MPILEMNNVSFRYDHQPNWVLHNIQLNVHKGEWLAIVGHNGSGKSTLAKLFNGLLLPQDIPLNMNL